VDCDGNLSSMRYQLSPDQVLLENVTIAPCLNNLSIYTPTLTASIWLRFWIEGDLNGSTTENVTIALVER